MDPIALGIGHHPQRQRMIIIACCTSVSHLPHRQGSTTSTGTPREAAICDDTAASSVPHAPRASTTRRSLLVPRPARTSSGATPRMLTVDNPPWRQTGGRAPARPLPSPAPLSPRPAAAAPRPPRRRCAPRCRARDPIRHTPPPPPGPPAAPAPAAPASPRRHSHAPPPAIAPWRGPDVPPAVAAAPPR